MMTTNEVPLDQRVPSSVVKVRYLGIDLARFLAIAGMIASHVVAIKLFLPGVNESDRFTAEMVDYVSNGIPAALFAVLGGVSIVFATRSRLRQGRTGEAIASVAVRGVVILLLGILLGLVEYDIVVILAYYGIAMILVSPLVRAPSWVLATVAGLLALVFGWLNIVARKALDIVIDGPHISPDFIGQDPIVALRALVVTGEYPAITWVTYLLVGMLIGRYLTAATQRGTITKSAGRLGVLGLMLFVFAQLVSLWVMSNLDNLGLLKPGSSATEAVVQLVHMGGQGAPVSTNLLLQLVAVPHSGGLFDLLRTVGIAAAVIGLLVFVCDRQRTPVGEASTLRSVGARALDIVRAAGAAPLTVYTLHIVLTAIISKPYLDSSQPPPESFDALPWWVAGPGAWILQIAGALVLGAVLSFTGRRGPLEVLLSKIVNFIVPSKRAVGGPSAESVVSSVDRQVDQS